MSFSVFAATGFSKTIEDLRRHVCEFYLRDRTPWVIAYSGGKDSTALLHLIWSSLGLLDPRERRKTVHVICVDTGVENPIFSRWARTNLKAIARSAAAQQIPLETHLLAPEVPESFWVQLIGRGYASPRRRFRWCTDRLKVRPVNRFLKRLMSTEGEAVLALGLRRQESVSRAANMKRHEDAGRTEAYVSPYGSLSNTWVYSPIEDWSDDDVWLYLMQSPSLWEMDHRELLALYRNATDDAECPLVASEGGSFCGHSRFGCWVCTLVERDRSMEALIENDPDMRWMLPLRRLRDRLKSGADAPRDFRRASGEVKLYEGRPIPGLYTREARHRWLEELLETQREVQAMAPEHFRDFELITIEELEEIRRIWMSEKHDLCDNLPLIYEAVLNTPYPGARWSEDSPFGAAEMELLRQAVDDDPLLLDLTCALLDVEGQFQTKVRRAGIFEALEKELRRGFYLDEADAVDRARRLQAVQTMTRPSKNEPS
jgi:DNA sulfur modification protein DndC